MGKTSTGKKSGSIVRNAFAWWTNDGVYITCKCNKKWKRIAKNNFKNTENYDKLRLGILGDSPNNM